MIPDPTDPNPTLIKLAAKAFRYDDVLTTWGWTHDIYLDTKSGQYLIADFPSEGHYFEMSHMPTYGPATVEAGGKTYNVKIYE
jgi:hypothetical protein